jgi:hypothetical protein
VKDILTQATEAAQRGEQLSRERDAYRYICAWDRGDLEAVCNLRERALHDKELEQILDELDEEFAGEMEKKEGPVSEEEAKRMHEKVKHLMKQYNEERG